MGAPPWLLERPIAHRGLHDAAPGVTDAPENSLAAIDAAIARGYAIELDVRALADGRVAVFHDDDLARMTGIAGAPRLDALRREQLAEYSLPGGHAIPLLEEALARVDGRAPLLLDLKSRVVGPLESALLATLARYRGPFALQSFNPLALGFFRRRAPTWPRGQLAYDFKDDDTLPRWQQFALRRLLLNVVSAPHFISYGLESLPFWVTTITRALGRPLLAWTVVDARGLARARALADNVIFECVLP
ncbi:MAG: glycerophosphodiester phosphodiesterase [Myxococcales bacterium]|nr:glycerophosphodiester phosphodiesterase [Myxococcales bacterium]